MKLRVVEMKAKPIGLIAVLAIAIVLMAAPASAEEQMVDFEDLPIGTEIGTNYVDRGDRIENKTYK